MCVCGSRVACLSALFASVLLLLYFILMITRRHSSAEEIVGARWKCAIYLFRSLLSYLFAAAVLSGDAYL